MIGRRLKWVVTLGMFLVVFLVASAVGSMAYFHFGDPQNTCASCHEMTGVHSAWSESAHRTLHCRNCHGGSLTLDAHALKSHINRVVQHFSGHGDKPIRLKETDVLRLHVACRSCHPQTFADWQGSRHSATYARIFLDESHNKMEQPAPDCLRCHGMFFKGHIEDLVSPLDNKGPWSLVDAAKRDQPAIPCLACHKIHAPAGPSTAACLYVRHEKAHISALLLTATGIKQGEREVRLSSDPRQRLCVQCHSPNALRQLGSSDDRTPAGVHEGLSCMDCHQTHSGSAKASCAACHPADSHCGLDVEKMDTTFHDLKSPHNIHTVACTDCHNGRRPGKKSVP